MGEPVDYKGYPTRPRRLGTLAWFYEGQDGITICQQPRPNVDAVSTTIPWKKILAAAARRTRLVKR